MMALSPSYTMQEAATRRASHKSTAVSPTSRVFPSTPRSPRGPRPGDDDDESRGSSLSEQIRKLSDSSMEAVKLAATGYLGFIDRWGRTLLLGLLVIPLLYLYTWAIDDMRFGISNARLSANQAVFAVQSELQAQMYEGSMTKELRLNLRERLQPILNEYIKILSNTDYEVWFQDSRDADDRIMTMFDALPPVDVKETGVLKARHYTKALIDMRATSRKRGELHFEQFLHARFSVVRKILEDSQSFHQYIDYKFTKGSKSSRIQDFINAQLVGRKRHYNPSNETSSILNHATQELLGKFLTAHRDLCVPELQTDGFWFIRFSVPLHNSSLTGLEDIEHAMHTERQFIRTLRERSPESRQFHDRHGASLRRIQRRMTNLQTKLRRIEAKLLWFYQRFETENTYEYNRTMEFIPKELPNRILWTQSINDLKESWAQSMAGTLETLIWAERHLETFREAQKSFNYEKNWDDWVTNNCGGTSCKETITANPVSWVFQRSKHAILGGKPLARKPDITKGQGDGLIRVYEKICCGEGGHNEWAKKLKYGNDKLVYQNPLHAEKTDPGASEDEK